MNLAPKNVWTHALKGPYNGFIPCSQGVALG